MLWYSNNRKHRVIGTSLCAPLNCYNSTEWIWKTSNSNFLQISCIQSDSPIVFVVSFSHSLINVVFDVLWFSFFRSAVVICERCVCPRVNKCVQYWHIFRLLLSVIIIINVLMLCLLLFRIFLRRSSLRSCNFFEKHKIIVAIHNGPKSIHSIITILVLLVFFSSLRTYLVLALNLTKKRVIFSGGVNCLQLDDKKKTRHLLESMRFVQVRQSVHTCEK